MNITMTTAVSVMAYESSHLSIAIETRDLGWHMLLSFDVMHACIDRQYNQYSLFPAMNRTTHISNNRGNSS